MAGEGGFGVRPGARTLWIAAGCAAGVLLLYLSIGTVTLFFLSLLLASALRPAVDLLARRLPRAIAAVVVMLAVAAAVVGIAASVLPALIAQGTDFVAQLPLLVSKAVSAVDTWRAGALRRIPESFSPQVQAELDKAVHAVVGFLTGKLALVLSSIPQVLGLVLVPVLTLFVLQEGPGMEAWLLGLVPLARRAQVQAYVDAAHRGLDGYVRGLTVVCTWQAIQASVVFTLIGMPYSVFLGLLAGLAEAIPYVGSTLVATLIVLAGLSQGGWHWAYGLGAYMGLNQLVNLVITPRVMSQHAELHPMATLLAVAAGAEIGGVPGVLMALPLTAVLKALLEQARAGPGG